MVSIETSIPFVLPGDEISSELHTELPDQDSVDCYKNWVVGPGLVLESNQLTAVKAGTLFVKSSANGGSVWVDTKSKRYVPVKGENVIGVVINKQADIFRVDIGSHEPASLSFLAFEGATKKNRPDVKIGDIIYAKLLVANKHMESELACIDSNGKANGLGVIRNGGTLIKVNLRWVRSLLSPDNQFIKMIGHHLPFELTIGVNGRIWVKGRSIPETIMICNLIEQGEELSIPQLQSILSKSIRSLSGALK